MRTKMTVVEGTKPCYFQKPLNKQRQVKTSTICLHRKDKIRSANSPFLLPHITYSRDGENFLINQRNSCWVIISFILMTSLTEKALTLQREI